MHIIRLNRASKPSDTIEYIFTGELMNRGRTFCFCKPVYIRGTSSGEKNII